MFQGKWNSAASPAHIQASLNSRDDLDYETTPSIHLQATATDAGSLSDRVPVSISLTNLAEPGNDRPEAQDASFGLPENSPQGTAVGTDTATDADTDGKPAFAINATSGVLSIHDPGDINFKTSPPFRLQVTATDRGGLSDTASINVNLITINDAPSAADKTVGMAKISFYTILANDFGFRDINDSPPNNLLAVKITALPDQGTLTNNGIPLRAQESIPREQDHAGGDGRWWLLG